MQFDHRIKFLRKIQISKKPIVIYYFFGEFCCKFAVMSLGEKSPCFSGKLRHFWFRKLFFGKIPFCLKFVTNLIFFFKNAKLQYITPAASTWFYFDIMNMGGKEWKRKNHEIVFASFFQNYHICPALNVTWSIQSELAKTSGLKFGSMLLDFILWLKTRSDSGFY